MSTSIRYGNGSYRAESIVKLTKDEYIAKNKATAFKGMPESNVVAKLGELWDMARVAIPVEAAEPAPIQASKKDSKIHQMKDKPSGTVPPAGGGETAE